MNIQITDSHLREYLKTTASPNQIKEYLSLCGPSIERLIKKNHETIYDIEITTNRIDIASIYGLAREAVAILPQFGIKAYLTEIETIAQEKPINFLPLDVEDKYKLCHRIMAVVLDNIQIKPSEDYIRQRLENAGIRTLNNVIDITNYLMLELGHPTHVFDYDRIPSHKLYIRFAKKGEKLITLDHKKYLLDNNDIVIDDGRGTIVDLPGIMGCENSVVTDKTKRIIFFIESNNPSYIRKTSMKYGIRTLAANYNEKNPDPQLIPKVIKRGIKLFQNHADAKIASNIIDIYPNPHQQKQIKTDVEFINTRLGVKLNDSKITQILNSLNFSIKKSGQNLTIIPPPYRFYDISIAEDIVEEVARIYGYYKLPGKLMSGEIPISSKSKLLILEENVKFILKYWGFTETYNYSFISKELLNKCNLKIEEHIRLANPLTEEIEFMRTSLVPSMLEVIARNIHLFDKLFLFEIASIYLKQDFDLPLEKSMLCLSSTDDYFRLKGFLEGLLAEFGIYDYTIEQTSHSFYHPKLCLSYLYKKERLATIGLLNPVIKNNYQFSHDINIGEIDLNLLSKHQITEKKYCSVSKYPVSFEDLTFKVNHDTRLWFILKDMKKLDEQIYKIHIIDRFNDFVTFRISLLNKNRNLTKDDIQKVREKIINHLKRSYNLLLKS